MERARARTAGDGVGAQAIKILMNSLFGVLGSPASRLFSPAVANAITTAGQYVIRLAAGAVEALGHQVIYGDTDSLFVDLGEPDTARAAARAEELRAAIASAVAEAITRDFGCASHLELEFEKVYVRFFLPEVRGGATGSKKRYAGLVVGGKGEELDVVGLEAVRRDWSGVARRFQRELLGLVFHDRPVADFIRAFVGDLRAGRFDGELAYRKAIRKPLAQYTKTDDDARLEETYHLYVDNALQRVPYSNAEGLQTVLDLLDDPQAREARPEQFVDNSYLRELEASGFVGRLYDR